MNQMEMIRGAQQTVENTSPQLHIAGQSSKVSDGQAKRAATEEIADKLDLTAVKDFSISLKSIKRDESLYSYDQDLDRLVVKILNSDTKELIRQIPSEDSLVLSRKMQQMIGLLFR